MVRQIPILQSRYGVGEICSYLTLVLRQQITAVFGAFSHLSGLIEYLDDGELFLPIFVGGQLVLKEHCRRLGQFAFLHGVGGHCLMS